MDSPGKNTGVGCSFFLPEIFPTQGSNPGLLKSPALAGRLFTTITPREAPGDRDQDLKNFSVVASAFHIQRYHCLYCIFTLPALLKF